MKGQGDGCKELKTAYKKWTGIWTSTSNVKKPSCQSQRSWKKKLHSQLVWTVATHPKALKNHLTLKWHRTMAIQWGLLMFLLVAGLPDLCCHIPDYALSSTGRTKDGWVPLFNPLWGQLVAWLECSHELKNLQNDNDLFYTLLMTLCGVGTAREREEECKERDTWPLKTAIVWFNHPRLPKVQM